MKSVKRKFAWIGKSDALQRKAEKRKAGAPNPMMGLLETDSPRFAADFIDSYGGYEPDTPATEEEGDTVSFHRRKAARKLEGLSLPIALVSAIKSISLRRGHSAGAGAGPELVEENPLAVGYTIYQRTAGPSWPPISRPASVKHDQPPETVPDSPLFPRDDVFTLLSLSAERASRPSDISWMTEMFPTIQPPALISQIVKNEFRAMDLARLNPRSKRGQFAGGCSPRDYPTLQSLLVPLTIYFRVLQAWIAVSGDAEATRVVGEAALRYNMHILDLQGQYQWPAVVRYHMHFHERRRVDMERGDYSKWAVGDRELLHRLLGDQEHSWPEVRRPAVPIW